MKTKIVLISLGAIALLWGLNIREPGRFIGNRRIASREYDLTASIPNKYYFTLTHEMPLRGPVYQKGNESNYFKNILGIILQRADNISKEKWYLPGKKNRFYYSFLLGALTVPFHESYWINFRKRANEVSESKEGNLLLCEQSANEFENLRSKFTPARLNSTSRVTRNNASYAQWVYNFLNDYFRTKFPHCSEFTEGEAVVQFLSSGGYVDMGMMQLNAKAHPNLYLDNSIFLLDKAIDYGLKYYLRGLERSFFKSNDGVNGYGCLRDEKGEINYHDLIISAWSGYYNSGPGGRACRYIDSIKCAQKVVADNKVNYYSWFKWNKKDYLQILQEYHELNDDTVSLSGRECDYAKNDMSMINDLRRVMEKKNAHFFSYLDRDSDEILAVNEIIENLVKGTDVRVHLDKVLQNNYLFDYKRKQYEQREYLLTSRNANIRLLPSGTSSKCGNTLFLPDDFKTVKVVGISHGFYKIVADERMINSMPVAKYSDPKCREVRYLYLYSSLAKEMPIIDKPALKEEPVVSTPVEVRQGVIRIGAGVRKSLDSRSAFSGFLPVGQNVQILEEQEYGGAVWYYIDDTNGVEGWVPKFYLN